MDATILQAVDDAANSVFDELFPKVNDHSEFKSRESEIRQHLRFEYAIPLGNRLIIDSDQPVNLQIQPQRIAEALAFVEDWNLQLTLYAKPALRQLLHH